MADPAGKSFRARIDAVGLAPLWDVFDLLMTREPRVGAVPALWRELCT